MHYTWFEIENFKSFGEQRFEFEPGLNLITGRNNSGKSALMEALSLQFVDKPHRNLNTIPHPAHTPSPASIARFGFAMSGEELGRVLHGQVKQFTLPVPEGGDLDAAGMERALASLCGRNTVEFTGQCQGGRITSPADGQGWDFYQPRTSNPTHARFVRPGNEALKFQSLCSPGTDGLAQLVSLQFQGRVFQFRAERMNISQGQYGAGKELQANAANLPEVLASLLGRNRARFDRFNHLVKRVLPEVQLVTARPAGGSATEIAIWEHDPSTEREDLAVPLAECGTGIGQVLAMLYVLVTADDGRVFIIDEPNSFLHPGATRALQEIFREHPQHQYIISTHSPQVIADAGRVPVFFLRKGVETIVDRLDPERASDASAILTGIGAKLSDVFGAEKVLWVEGETEERCFKVLCRLLLRVPLGGKAIVGVLHTGDFESRKNAQWAFNIYRRLTTGAGLVPPALGFVFDREERSQRERDDLVRQSGGRVAFLARRMYENYLLDAEAIAAVLNETEALRDSPVEITQVEAALSAALQDPKSHTPGRADGLVTAHGAHILEGLFSSLTQARHEYIKTQHAEALTVWLIKNRPEALDEVAELLRKVLSQ